MGPLKGYRILEFAGIGPGPFCAMMLSDLGAEVIRIDRKSSAGAGSPYDVLNRGRRSLALDLKVPESVEAVLRMVEQADALFEGFRPGVMERLGIGPKICLARNPKLVYGRMTGWGQKGPLAHAAGHDINYISLNGILHAIGTPGAPPVPPLNLVGDFGGGGMLLALGLVCALLETQKSGEGQVIDAAMVDGSSALLAGIYGGWSSGGWHNERGANTLDGGAHFYGAYECADGKYVSVGAIEPQFYALLLEHLGTDDESLEAQLDRDQWPEFKVKLAAIFMTKTRGEWCEIMEGTDICFAPILDFEEIAEHPHNKARNAFVEVDGVMHQAPAPRFSRTPAEIQGPPPRAGEHSEAVLTDWGFGADEIGALRDSGAV